MKYGYISPDDERSGSLRSPDSIKQAVQQFQRFAGLPVTGKSATPPYCVLSRPWITQKPKQLSALIKFIGTGGGGVGGPKDRHSLGIHVLPTLMEFNFLIIYQILG